MMFSHFRIVLISILISTFAIADVFMTELGDPNNSANSRFIELYNNGDSDVDLSTYQIMFSRTILLLNNTHKAMCPSQSLLNNIPVHKIW